MRWVVLGIALTAFLFPMVARAQCSNPTAPVGSIIFNEDHDVYQGCTTKGWWSFHEYPTHPCTGTTTDPAIGETCTDGSIYAGLSPDGNVPMYTTPADAPSLMSWNDGSSNWEDTAMQNCESYTPGDEDACFTGAANTSYLVNATSNGDHPYQAAQYCSDLNSHGHDDWYLPAQDELDVIYQNQNVGALNGTIDDSFDPPGYYWTSSEYSLSLAIAIQMPVGAQVEDTKSFDYSVRCVRKGD